MFTENAFALLEGLAATPTKAFYEQHKNEIVADIQNPLRGMFQLVQQRMPESILCTLETEKRILSNILKNDYGKGGAYDFLWGAFYPKGHKRSHSAQLSLNVTKNDLAAGFYVGENDENVQNRFKANCKKPKALNFAAELDQQFGGCKIVYGAQTRIELTSFAEWFQRVDDLGVGVRVFFSKEEVLRLSSAELADKVSELFIKFFPLFFIALEEDPFPAIESFQKGTSIEGKSILLQKTQYWTWSAGEGAKYWNEFYKQGIAAIGWDHVGDLRQYRSKDEICSKLSKSIVDGAPEPSNNALACWEFANEIKIGDIIFSKQGKSKIIGYGVVEGDYEFDDSREKYKQIRKVRWLSKGEWVLPNGNEMAVKTLTNITPFSDFVTIISNLVGLQLEEGGANVLPNNPAYSVAECAKESGFSVEDIEQWVRAINRKGQAIFYGAPGTGKTFIADKLARHLIGNGNGFADLIQFHPAYSYEDFIEGIRPATEGGQLSYAPAAGRFLDFCKKAEERDGVCVLIIDEINRANLSRVFGELMYLLEYRDQEMVLAGGTKFRIPNNVRIIGTMNTADRSIALVDHALRRRFSFIPLSPRYEVIESFHEGADFNPAELIKVLKSVNALINDKHYHIGISFFLREDLRGEIADIWNLEIEPYLEEFFFDQQEKMEQFRWSKIESKVLGA
jgi:hypothetical protein